MDCPAVTSLEEATKEIPNSLFPVNGLRRGDDGALTPDALTIVVDGLKSRGIDPTDKPQKNKLLADTAALLCRVNAQYQFLIGELGRSMQMGLQPPAATADAAKARNYMLSDLLAISRHLYSIKPFDSSNEFIEGWQVTPTASILDRLFPGIEAFTATLSAERQALELGEYEKLRRHMVEVTQEKNRYASNYLGFYGFLNLVAVGLLLYIAGANNGQ